MKKTMLFIAFAMVSIISRAQDIPDYDAIPVEQKSDFNETANDAALKAANYILSVPPEKNNASRQKSISFLIRWMTNTPAFTFAIDAGITKYYKKNDDLLPVYIAAMSKYALENKADAGNEKSVKLNTYKTFIAYCKTPENNVKINNDLQKLIDANDKGELEKFLKI